MVEFRLLALFQQLPDFGLSGFQLGNIVCIESPVLIDAAADVIDVSSRVADGSGQLFLLGVIDLDDVAVNSHLAKIGSHVFSAKLLHLFLD